MAQNPQVQALKTKLADLMAQKTKLAERYGAIHPQIVAVNSQIADAQTQLQIETSKALQSIKNEYDTAVLTEEHAGAEPSKARRPTPRI